MDEINHISDLFAEEDIAPEFTNAPTVTINLPGREPLYVAMTGETMSVREAMNAANIMLPAGTNEVWVDGQQGGIDTILREGAQVTPVGNVKGG